jgi:hypothetical protein
MIIKRDKWEKLGDNPVPVNSPRIKPVASL